MPQATPNAEKQRTYQKSTYTSATGLQLIVCDSEYRINSNLLDVYYKGREDYVPFFITKEMYCDDNYMEHLAKDLRDGYVPFTGRNKLMAYKQSDAEFVASRLYTNKDAAIQIQTIVDKLPLEAGEEVTNVAYCPQTRVLTIKSITHKTIQL